MERGVGPERKGRWERVKKNESKINRRKMGWGRGVGEGEKGRRRRRQEKGRQRGECVSGP
jgi:hypothetical protein